MLKLKRKERVVVSATLALVLYTLSLSIANPVLSSLLASRRVSNTGTVKTIGVGVYWDYECTTPVPSIDWGTLEPGSSKNVTCYIRNEGNSPSTLSIYTSNWNPLNASEYITLTWDYGGESIDPNEARAVTFTLSISASIEGITDFSFDISIEGMPTTGTTANLHVLDSTPEGPVPYTIDGQSGYETGVNSIYTISAGVHTIELPSPYTAPSSGITYYFMSWEDGSTENPRTIILTADESYDLFATYSTSPPDGEPPPPDTEPPPPNGDNVTYSFVHITDTQYLSRDYPDNLNALFSHVESIKVEYNIKWISFSGDMVQNWGSDSQWNTFLSASSLTSVPIEYCAGNHDNDWGRNFYWYNQYIGEDKQYYYTVHEDFICLYISWFGSSNTMDATMISYFQNAIADNPTKIPLIVTHWYMDVDSSLASLAYQIHDNGLVQPPVSIVLCGHMHDSFSNTRTVDGTTVYEFMTNYQEESGYACFRLFTVYDSYFTERVLRIRPEPVSWVTEEKSYPLF